MSINGNSPVPDQPLEVTHEQTRRDLFDLAIGSAVLAVFFGVLMIPLSFPNSLLCSLSVVWLYTSVKIVTTLSQWNRLELCRCVASVSHLSLIAGVWLCMCMQILYWALNVLSFTATLAPLALAVGLKAVIFKRVRLSVTKCLCYILYVILTTVLFLPGLKLDGVVELTWFNSFWPVWIALAVLLTLSTGTVVAFLGSLIRVCFVQNAWNDLAMSLWMCLSTLGFALAYGYFCVCLASSDSSVTIHSWAPCVFHLAFAILTVVCQRLFSQWWTSAVSEEEDDLEEPRSARYKVAKLMQKAPKALIRISGAYFRPVKSISLNQKPQSTDSARKEPSQASMPVLDTGNDESHDECGVCRVQWSDAVIQPCGHSALCFQCGIDLKHQGKACHICRSPIEALLKVDTRGHEVFKVLKQVRFP